MSPTPCLNPGYPADDEIEVFHNMLLMIWLVAFLYHILPPAIAFSTTDPPQKKNDIHHIPSLGGITSILSSPHVPSSDTSTYFIGTKRGKIKQVNIPIDLNRVQSTNDNILQTIQIENIEDANGKIIKPYPIFSLLDCEMSNNHNILAGGGDRYITVWRQNEQGEWIVVDQLGPHTGWVKDLATCSCSSFDSEEDTHMYLFSIGCNCIEVWCTIDGKYKHVHKLQIDSSVELGCTLSSDLLCLATYADECSNSKEKNYIFAGGVDGRIHRWSIHSSSNDKFLSAGSFSAHNGRVNGLTVCRSMGVLVSIGSDGYVHCRLMDSSNHPSKWKVVSLDISDYFRKDNDTISSQRKATSLCIVYEESRSSIVCVGTSCGYLVLINIDKSDDDVIHAFFNDVEIASEEVEGTVVIHALCSNQYEDYSRILIGHSNGLSICNVPIRSSEYKLT